LGEEGGDEKRLEGLIALAEGPVPGVFKGAVVGNKLDPPVDPSATGVAAYSEGLLSWAVWFPRKEGVALPETLVGTEEGVADTLLGKRLEVVDAGLEGLALKRLEGLILEAEGPLPGALTGAEGVVGGARPDADPKTGMLEPGKEPGPETLGLGPRGPTDPDPDLADPTADVGKAPVPIGPGERGAKDPGVDAFEVATPLTSPVPTGRAPDPATSRSMS
jgi:hypothetical protein